MKCPGCGAEVKEGAKFCIVCGMKLPKFKKCPKCGSEFPEDMLFCSKCGSRLEQQAEPAADHKGKEQNNPWKWVAIVLIAMLLLGGGTAFWFLCMAPQISSEDISAKVADSEQASSDAAVIASKGNSDNQVVDIIGDVKSTVNAVQSKQEDAERMTVDDVQSAAEVVEETINGPTVQLRANSASGKCDRDHNVVYKASNLIDGNIRTCWALDIRGKSNYKSQGFGPVKFSINCRRLDYIVVYNGYQKNDRTYWGNPRAKTIAMYNADDMSSPILDGSLDDTMEGQEVYAIDNSANRHITQILMYFPHHDYYYPAEWNDLSISEIKFYGVK